MSQKRDAVYASAFQTRNSSLGDCPSALVARSMLGQSMSRELKTTAAHNHNCYSMRKFLLGLIAVASVLLPLSQNAQAHWGYYHRYYGGYHHAYWHHGYWYAGYRHPGYCYPGPVTVV